MCSTDNPSEDPHFFVFPSSDVARGRAHKVRRQPPPPPPTKLSVVALIKTIIIIYTVVVTVVVTLVAGDAGAADKH